MPTFMCRLSISEATGGSYCIPAKSQEEAANKVVKRGETKIRNMIKRGYFEGRKAFDYEIAVGPVGSTQDFIQFGKYTLED